MQITKQHFAVLISLLFAVSLSADPIIHSLETEDHHEIIECQVCESESFKSYDYFLLASYASTTTINARIEENYKIFSFKGFSARAPPSS